MTDDDLIRDFLAQRKATVVPTGQTTMTRAQMYRRVRGIPDPVVVTPDDDDRVRVYIDSAGREFYFNSEGEPL
jgi:hypothetical protein